MTDTLEDLRMRLRQFADERDWHQFHSPKNLIMALSGEVGELTEHFQWLSEAQSEVDQLAGDVRAEVEDEVADVFLYLIRLADRLQIDLSSAAKCKIEKNATRYPVKASRGNAIKYSRRDP